MHTKSREGQAFTEEKKEGRRRERENGQKKSKNHPREEEKEAGRTKGAKREREKTKTSDQRFFAHGLILATQKMYFLLHGQFPRKIKGHRVSHTDVMYCTEHTLNRVNELIITPRLSKLVIRFQRSENQTAIVLCFTHANTYQCSVHLVVATIHTT